MRRLEAAADDPQTARMMVSPLQVTIMTLLIESYGRAPSWRHRLFDAYYQTIYRREAARPGRAGRLLEEREADITFLHERVGLELQKASEADGASDAVLSRDDLVRLATDRLQHEHGHSADDAHTLAESFLELATSRLVLLVPHHDGLGFEIRSLQEYMAARALTNGPDDVVLRRLTLAAPSAHWRNTWLLAFARALQTKHYLRDQLMGSVRSAGSDPLAKRIGIGPELAHDLLADSIGTDSPKLRNELVDTLLEIFDLPPRPLSVSALLMALSDESSAYKAIILDRMRRGIASREDTQAATWSILKALEPQVGVVPATARALLHQMKPHVSQQAALEMLTDGGDMPPTAPTSYASLRSFFATDPATLLDERQLEDAQAFLETLQARRALVLRDHPNVVLPLGSGTLMHGVSDANYPRDENVRLALAMALDTIDPTSWGASIEIRNSLWRGVRRQPIRDEINDPR
jgi:hypothetical protein